MNHWRQGCMWILLSLLVLSPFIPSRSLSTEQGAEDKAGRIFLSGRILDHHNEPVVGAHIQLFLENEVQGVYVQGQYLEAIESEADGSYLVELPAPEGFGPGTKLDVEIHKPSFKSTRIEVAGSDFAQRAGFFFLHKDIIIPRTLGPAFWIATMIFLIAYALIAFELLHRTIAAMLGTAVILAISYTFGTLNPEYHVVSFESAMAAIDMNVILLLMGMMIIVGVLKNTGVFQWSAYKCFQIARGNVMVLSVVLMTFTAVASAFLDNVTTMLLLTPVTIEIALSLRISPLALLIPEVLASNIGGTATLIGDPPNIMIGSYTGLTFMTFVENLAVVCAIAMLALFITNKFFYGKVYRKAEVKEIDAFIRQLREQYQITDKTLLGFGLGVLAFVIFLFVSHGYWHMEVSVAALIGASILFTYGILTNKVKMLEVIEKDIEWPTLLFFMFLFILVGCVEEAGLLSLIADWVLKLSRGDLVMATVLILWVSAIMSAFVDNIPFTATMLPITAYLSQVIPGAENNVLWWALALGACYGGNGTMIGASANVVTMGIAEAAGYPIRFFDFMKVGFVYMICSLIIANIWLLIFY
jgi:Na+/H+ antiporter NhaD/arsenite permease-like protein